jgi:hypothetical protein
MVSGTLGAIFGLIGGGFFFLVSMVVGLNATNADTVTTLGSGVAGLIFAPVLYGGAAFVGGVINAFIYNILAGMTGGLQMEFSRE